MLNRLTYFGFWLRRFLDTYFQYPYYVRVVPRYKYTSGFVPLFVVLILVLAIPLFVWGIMNSNLDIRNRAASGKPTPTPVKISCLKNTGCPKGFTCVIEKCLACPVKKGTKCVPCAPKGYCQKAPTPSPKPSPKPTPILTPEPTNSPVLQIIPNTQWLGIDGEPGDYKIIDANGKTLVYLSPSYGNHGRIVALTGITGSKNLVNSTDPLASGAIYSNFLLWPYSLAANAWTGGIKNNYFSVTEQNSSNKGYVAWKGSWHDPIYSFDSTLDQKIKVFSYKGDQLLIVQAKTQFIANKDINQFRQMWVELGWHANDFKYVTAQTIKGPVVVDMSGDPGAHHFWGLKAKTGGYLIAYNSNNLDASLALMFTGVNVSNLGNGYLPINSDETYLHSWDTWNTDQTDHTDTMELHITNPEFSQEKTPRYHIPVGTIITLEYYILLNNNPNTSNWVPDLSQLQDLFSN